MTPTSEVVARLTTIIAEFDSHIVAAIDEPGDKWDGFVEVKISDLRSVAALISSLVAERDSWRRVAERCKSEAEGHSMEARTANSTINEIYQVLTGGRGEPGNWHGAEPARQYVAEAERLLAEAREALIQIATGKDKDGNAVDFLQDIAGEALASIGGGNG